MNGVATISRRVAKEADRSGWLYDTMRDGHSMKQFAIPIACRPLSPLHVRSPLATVVVVQQHKCIVAAVEIGALYAVVESDSNAALGTKYPAHILVSPIRQQRRQVQHHNRIQSTTAKSTYNDITSDVSSVMLTLTNSADLRQDPQVSRAPNSPTQPANIAQ